MNLDELTEFLGKVPTSSILYVKGRNNNGKTINYIIKYQGVYQDQKLGLFISGDSVKLEIRDMLGAPTTEYWPRAGTWITPESPEEQCVYRIAMGYEEISEALREDGFELFDNFAKKVCEATQITSTT